MRYPIITPSLTILRLPETGPATFWQLIDTFGSASAVIAQPAATLGNWLKPAAIQALADYQANPVTSLLAQRLAGDLAYLDAQDNLCCITFDDSRYPQLLLHIPKPPPVLFIRGDAGCLDLPQIAIVGSRNPSAGGNENAGYFARHLAQCGFAITSGLALGVDAAAHRGALTAQGKTIAVMGTGIDLVYPARHRPLAQQIIDAGGALVSEFPLGTASLAANFPQRNRIISGLSCGTLVVEAALQSGSLITASYALQHNREVFAIPGSIHNPLARGCHQLIRQGATLVETAQDIIEQLDGMLSFKMQESRRITRGMSLSPVKEAPPELEPGEQAVVDAMGFDPVTIDALIERTTLEAGELIACLMALEIKGVVVAIAAGYQRV